jgi:hypothetical protein
MVGGEVMLCDCVVVVVVASLHPQIYPGVLQVVVLKGTEINDVEVGSLQPNHPGVLQVDVSVGVGVLVLI